LKLILIELQQCLVLLIVTDLHRSLLRGLGLQ
jgi:hypothetical protein